MGFKNYADSLIIPSTGSVGFRNYAKEVVDNTKNNILKKQPNPIQDIKEKIDADNDRYMSEDAYALKIDLDKFETAVNDYGAMPSQHVGYEETARKSSEAEKYLNSLGITNLPDAKKVLAEKREYYNKVVDAQTNDKAKKDAAAQQTTENNLAGTYEAEAGLEKFERDEREAESKKPSTLQSGIVKGFITSSDTPIGTAINTVSYDYGNDDSYRKPTNEWSDTQKKVFGYYYYYDPSKAFSYAESLNNAINKAKTDKQDEKNKETFSKNAGTMLGGAGLAILTAPTAIADFLDNAIEYSARGTITEKNAHSPFDFGQSIISGVSQNLNEKYGTIDENVPIIGGKGLGDLYSLGTSIAQSASYTVFGPAASIITLISYFGQGAASGVDDALSRGATGGQALLYGAALGVAEGLAEKVGIDNLFKVGASKTAKNFIKNVTKLGAAEGLEEGLTSTFNEFADRLIMQDKSNFNAMVKDFENKGFSTDAAKNKAWTKTAENIAYDMLGGFISGGVHGGSTTLIKGFIDKSLNKSNSSMTSFDSNKNVATNNTFNKTVPTGNNASFFNLSAANPKNDIVGDAIAKSSGVPNRSADQRTLQRLGRAFGTKIEFADLDYTTTDENGNEITISPEGQFDKDANTITLNTNAKDYHRPVEFIVKHELSHRTEIAGYDYEKFMGEVIHNSDVFNNYVQQRGFENVETWIDDVIAKYQKSGKPLGSENESAETAAKKEIVADFVADVMFNGRNLDTMLNAMDPVYRNKFVKWISEIFQKLKDVFKGQNQYTEIERLEKQFLDVAKKAAKQKNTTDEGGGVKYSIAYTTNNKPVLVVNDDILKNATNNKEKVAIVKQSLGRFKKVPIKGQTIHFIADTKQEYTSSKYSRWLSKNDQTIFDDKMRVAAHPQDIVYATTDYINESLNHSRKDNIIDFARGTLLIDVAGRQYESEVVIGFTKSGICELHDIVNLTPTKFEYKKETVSKGIDSNESTRSDTTSKHSIPTKTEIVNKNLTETDRAYLDAVESGDMDTVQRLVDRVAKKSGYTIKAYHGTPNNSFAKFDFEKIGSNTDSGIFGMGFYFTTHKDTADIYATENGQTMPVYLRVNRPWWAVAHRNIEDVAAELGMDETALTLRGYGGRGRIVAPTMSQAGQFSAHLQEHGYDSVIVQHGKNNSEIVMFDNAAIKSAEPVTYDDDGKVIPLSERFKADNPDIRYSLPDNPTALEIGDAYKNGEITSEEYVDRINGLWEETGKAEGTIKPGEIVEPPNKRVPTPKSVSDGTQVRQFMRTVLESGYATPEMEAYLKELILEGDYSYFPTSNKKSIDKAERNIKNQGYRNAVSNWQRSLSKSTVDADTVATGEALLRMAFDQHNAVDIVNLTADLAELGTRMGQAVQAFSLLKRMGGISQLVYLQRSVNKINEDLKQRFKGSKKDAPVVKMNEKLAERLAKAETEGEKEVIYGRIVKDIADQVPSTFLDKWNAWRYMAMLFNPTTHIRNVLGNGIFLPVVRMKDLIALGGEKIFVKAEDRTKVLKVKQEYQDFAEKDFLKIEPLLTGTGKYNPSDNIRDEMTVFKNKILEGLRKFNFTALEKEDAIFLRKHYRHALGSFLQARNIDLKNMSNAQLLAAREYAFNEALKATYRDASKVANMLSQLSKTSKFANVLVEGVLPFKKTPINILKRGVEYSPIGIIKTLSKGIYDLKKGEFNAAQFIDGLAANAIGSIPFVVGMFLANLGIAKGGFDDEEEIDKLMGKQEYSIQIGDTSYTIDWLAPASIPFFMGVAISEYEADEDGDFLSNLYDFGIKGFEPILNLSMLSGVNDMIDSVSYAEDAENLPQLIGSGISSYFSQALPTIFGKTANIFDDTKRTRYVDKTSNVPEIVQKALDKIASKTPIASRSRAEYIDAWGETKYTGNFFQRFFQQFVSPGYASTVDQSAISEECLRLYRETGEKSVVPSTPAKYFTLKGNRIDLSKEEYYNFATFRGQMSADLVNEAINNAEYQKLTDEQKAEVITDIYDYVGALAKSQLSYSYEEIAAMEGGEDVLTPSRWNKLNDKAKQLLVNGYFLDGTKGKAYKQAQNGKSVADFYIKKVKSDSKK